MSERFAFVAIVLGIIFCISFSVGLYHYKQLEMAKLNYCEVENPRGYTHWEKCNK